MYMGDGDSSTGAVVHYFTGTLPGSWAESKVIGMHFRCFRCGMLVSAALADTDLHPSNHNGRPLNGGMSGRLAIPSVGQDYSVPCSLITDLDSSLGLTLPVINQAT